MSQGKPLVFKDLRSDVAFNKCHIRGSESICFDANSAGIADVDNLLTVAAKNSFILVCVTDFASVSKLSRYLALVNEANITKLLSIEHLDFDEFYGAYPKCAFAYIGTDFPSQSMRNPAKDYPTEIMPQFMYLGNYYDASDSDILSHLEITHIVDATGEKLSQATADKLGIAYLPIHIWDIEGADITQHFDQVFEFLDQARSNLRGKVIVHCRAGISRSATLVLAYMLRTRMSDNLQSALRLVLTERPYVLPNSSFREQLRNYEQCELCKSSFNDDNDMMTYISSISHCWSGLFTRETDFDKVPIAFSMQKANAISHLDEFPDPDTAAAVALKPKKPFLKRHSARK